MRGIENEDEIKEFLQRKGALEILEVIGSDGSRWTEMEETVGVSSATLDERLERGLTLDLFETESRNESGSIGTYYILTDDLGDPILEEMRKSTLVGTIQVLRKSRNERAAKEESLLEFVSEHLDRAREIKQMREEDDPEDFQTEEPPEAPLPSELPPDTDEDEDKDE